MFVLMLLLRGAGHSELGGTHGLITPAFTTDLIITRQGEAVTTQRDDDDEDEETGGAHQCAL